MNRKLKIALRRRSSEQGFAIPIAVGMGLVMLLVGVTMIVRSQGDQVTASAQKNTAQSLAVAEGGISRTLSQLNQINNAVLLRLTYDPLSGGKQRLGPDGVQNSGDETATAVDEWSTATAAAVASSIPCVNGGGTPAAPNVPLTATSIGSGNYKILAYRYNATTNTGTLLVEGTQGTQIESVSRIRVQVPLGSRDNFFPTLYAKFKVKLQNGNVIGPNAKILTSLSSGNVPPGVDNCNATEEQRKKAVEMQPQGEVNGNTALMKDIVIGDLTLPAIPTAPVAAAAVSATLGPPPTPAIPAYSGTRYLGDVSSGDNNVPGTDTGYDKLPTVADAKYQGAYHFKTLKIDLNGNDKFKVDTTNGPVYLYVTEELTLAGTSMIENSRTDGQPPKAGDLRIFVSAGKQIQSKGNSCIDNAFIFAPDSTLQANGSGACPGAGGNADINGAAWVREWDGSGNNQGINMPADMSAQVADFTQNTGLPNLMAPRPATSWQRQENL